MLRTLADVEVETTTTPTATIIPPTPRVDRVVPDPTRHDPAEQSIIDSKLFWMIAPLALLIVGSTTFLAIRRWLKRSGQNNDELA